MKLCCGVINYTKSAADLCSALLVVVILVVICIHICVDGESVVKELKRLCASLLGRNATNYVI